MEIIINDILYNTSDFAIEEIAEKSGKTVKEVKAIILAQAKIEGEQFVSEIADRCHDQLSKVSAQKMTRYQDKALATNNYKANKATDAEIAGLQEEADARGITIEEHVDGIVAANAFYRGGSAKIEALEARGKKAVNDAKTLEELEVLKNIIQQEAAEELAKWQAAQEAFEQWKQSNGLS